jgi:prepilin-type N-terminal cleavage/methylation domain-containing protein
MDILTKHTASQKGFTLLEIIVTIILVGITAAIMFPVMGTNLIRSAEPVNRLNDHHLLIQEMDRLTGLYRDAIQNDTLNINTFKTTYVDTSIYVNAGETSFITLSDGTYTTTSPNILRVTLVNNSQSLVALFTQ